MRVVTGLAVLVLALGCVHQAESARGDANAAPTLVGHPQSAAARDSIRAAHARTGHVIIVSIDGLRPDAIGQYGAATLDRLRHEGRYALRARTILPSTTMPSHASMLTGVGPFQHRILWNDDDSEHDAVSVPSVFSIAKGEGLSTAAFYSKSKFTQLFSRSALDMSAAPTRSEGMWPGESTVAHAAAYLRTASPSLLFVHLGEPDDAGHSSGWMSTEYGQAVRSTDLALGHLLARADTSYGRGKYTVIVTADHGGHNRTHGTPRSDDLLIPWIVWGAGVETGAPLTEAVRTMDTAATALWLLGVDVPRGWDGRVVRGAFTPK